MEEITDFKEASIGDRQEAIQHLASFLSNENIEETRFYEEEDWNLFLDAAKEFADYWVIPFDQDLWVSTLEKNHYNFGEAWNSSQVGC